MDCETFRKSINEFKHHPILFNRLIEIHLKENNCDCFKIEGDKYEPKRY